MLYTSTTIKKAEFDIETSDSYAIIVDSGATRTDVVESHPKQELALDAGDRREIIKKPVSEHDGHVCIILGNKAVMIEIAQSMINIDGHGK
eukprot:IDg1656t1